MRRAAIFAALPSLGEKENHGRYLCPLADKAFEAAQRKSSFSTASKPPSSSPVRIGGRTKAAMKKKPRCGTP